MSLCVLLVFYVHSLFMQQTLDARASAGTANDGHVTGRLSHQKDGTFNRNTEFRSCADDKPVIQSNHTSAVFETYRCHFLSFLSLVLSEKP